MFFTFWQFLDLQTICCRMIHGFILWAASSSLGLLGTKLVQKHVTCSLAMNLFWKRTIEVSIVTEVNVLLLWVCDWSVSHKHSTCFQLTKFRLQQNSLPNILVLNVSLSSLTCTKPDCSHLAARWCALVKEWNKFLYWASTFLFAMRSMQNLFQYDVNWKM